VVSYAKEVPFKFVSESPDTIHIEPSEPVEACLKASVPVYTSPPNESDRFPFDPGNNPFTLLSDAVICIPFTEMPGPATKGTIDANVALVTELVIK
jgi:hypothetical protein